MDNINIPSGWTPGDELYLEIDIDSLLEDNPTYTWRYVRIVDASGNVLSYGTGNRTGVGNCVRDGMIYFDVMVMNYGDEYESTLPASQYTTISFAPTTEDPYTGCNGFVYLWVRWDGISNVCLWVDRALAARVPSMYISELPGGNLTLSPLPTIDNKFDLTPYVKLPILYSLIGHFTGDGGAFGDERYFHTAICGAEGDVQYADFEGHPTTIYEGEKVTFNCTSTACSETAIHIWDFGDGTTGGNHDVEKTYAHEGRYTVTLTILDGTKRFEKRKEDYITVIASNAIPIDFTAYPRVVKMGDTVTFTDLYPVEHEGRTSSWDFGDGTFSSESNPTHTYATSGTYTVALGVTGVNPVSKVDYIIVVPELSAVPGFAADKTQILTQESIAFTNQTISDLPDWWDLTYTWHFGDGSTSHEINPHHIYSEPGKYTVSLTITAVDPTEES